MIVLGFGVSAHVAPHWKNISLGIWLQLHSDCGMPEFRMRWHTPYILSMELIVAQSCPNVGKTPETENRAVAMDIPKSFNEWWLLGSWVAIDTCGLDQQTYSKTDETWTGIANLTAKITGQVFQQTALVWPKGLRVADGLDHRVVLLGDVAPYRMKQNSSARVRETHWKSDRRTWKVASEVVTMEQSSESWCGRDAVVAKRKNIQN